MTQHALHMHKAFFSVSGSMDNSVFIVDLTHFANIPTNLYFTYVRENKYNET